MKAIILAGGDGTRLKAVTGPLPKPMVPLLGRPLMEYTLLLLKKQKARHIFGVLLLIPASFVLAFLAAGFPATTIAPMRELLFVCFIAVLLIGAGLSARAVFKHN